jgi:hypothetical protein
VSADVPDSQAKLAWSAGAGIALMLIVAAGAASLPLAELARQDAGSDLIFHVAVTLLALVLGGVGFVVAR